MHTGKKDQLIARLMGGMGSGAGTQKRKRKAEADARDDGEYVGKAGRFGVPVRMCWL